MGYGEMAETISYYRDCFDSANPSGVYDYDDNDYY